MFLLPRFDKVSEAFSVDVAIVREFLQDRGISSGSTAALTTFSARLAIDPSFRRDVVSLMQAVVQREGEAVDYIGLLGILIVAAAGRDASDSNDEQEEAAREILRFLTHVPRPQETLPPVFVVSRNVIPAIAAARPHSTHCVSQTEPEIHQGPASFSPVEGPRPTPWRKTAALAAAVLFVFVLGAAWLHYRKARPATQTVAVPESNTHIAVPTHEATPGDDQKAPSFRPPSPTTAQRLNPQHTHPAQPPMLAENTPTPPPRSSGEITSLPPAKPAPATTPERIAATPAPRESTAETAHSSIAETSSTPYLHRRLPQPTGDQLASMHSYDPYTNSNESAQGIVHPASIGMMASNLISSPAPDYPVAASRARVEGSVMVRAIVDREGNVIDAHVISGPELLRDASLQAVQQWHYKPYTQGGRPIAVATTAVLDFQLK